MVIGDRTRFNTGRGPPCTFYCQWWILEADMSVLPDGSPPTGVAADGKTAKQLGYFL